MTVQRLQDCATWVFGFVLATVVTTLVIGGMSTQRAAAASNSTLNFQARILQSNGALVPDGNYNVEFKIYDSASAGASGQGSCSLNSSSDDCWWVETRTGGNAVRVVDGYVTVNLGSVTAFGSTIPWDQDLYVTMRVGGIGAPSWDTEMVNLSTGRMKLTAVPYAFRAANLMNAAGTLAFNADSLTQLAPASAQTVNSANTAINVNQTGAGALLDLKQAGSSKLLVANNGLVTLSSGIILGTTSTTTAGALRWTGTDFEGYNGSNWLSLTQGGNSAATATITSGVANLAGTATATATGLLTMTSATAVSVTAGSTTGFVAPSSGSFRACTVVGNASRTGGTASLRWRVNGVSVGSAACIIDATNPRTSSTTLGSGVVRFNAGDTINVVFDSAALLPAASTDYTVYWTVEYGTTPNAGSAFVQGGNAFSATATLGTTDNNALSFITNNTEKVRIETSGNVGIGTSSTPGALLSVGGTIGNFQVNSAGNITTNGTLGVTGATTLSSTLAVTGNTTLTGNLVANGSATATTGTTTAPARSNSTTVVLSAAGAFANNDVIFINNAGQDYYTRITAGGGTTTLTVSPAVSYDAGGVTVTKYNIQNVGATATDYVTQANRFFQGYFLGGVVVGAGSTTLSDGNLSRTTGDIQLTPGSGGVVQVNGTINATTITGDGSSITNINSTSITGATITNLNASNIASGTVGDSYLSANVTLQGNTFNGANQLIKLDGSGALPAISGAAVTSLNASNLSTGTVASGLLSGSYTGVTGLGVVTTGTWNATALTDAFVNDDLTISSSGTVDWTALNNYPAACAAGSAITALGDTVTCQSFAPASGSSSYIQLQGATPGTAQTGNINISGTIIAGTFSGSGASLTNLDAGAVSSGTLNDSRLSANVTLQGNSFNSANQLVKLDGSGALPAISGAALTGLNGSNISSGTVADGRLSANVALLSGTQSFTGLKTFGAGATITAGQTFTVNGDALTDLTGTGLANSGGALSVAYGSAAGTAVQGNTSLTCPSGTGNLTGGGNSITLGSGGTCNAISTNNAVTFSTSVTSPSFTGSGSVTLSSGGAGDLTLDSASNVLVLSDATLRRLAAGTTTLQLNDVANTTFAITNTDGTAVANLSVEGSATAASFSGSGAGLTSLNASNIASGTIADGNLSANVALLSGTQSFTGTKTFSAGATITAGQTFTVNGDALTDLTGTGLVNTGGTLSVSYGSAAGTAVQGNTSLTCPSGTGNLTGGGNAITLGSGGTCNAISTNNAVTFSTSVTSPLHTGAGAVTLSSGGAGDLTLDSASNILVLSDATLRRLAAGTTTLQLNDVANTTFAITNTDGTATAGLSVEGAVSAASFSGSGAGLTSLNASNIASGTIADGNLSTNVALLTGTQSFSGTKTFSAGATITAGQTFTINGDGLTDLTGTGLANSGGALSVAYGSAAGTAVQGNTSLTCPSGTGNLTGGGNSITLGAGGTCNSISTNNAVTFSTSVTSPSFTSSGAVSLTSGGANAITIDTGLGAAINIAGATANAVNIGRTGINTTITGTTLVLGTATVQRTAAGSTTFDFVDGANTTLNITNSNGTGVANVTVEGTLTANSLAGTGGSITAINATNVTTGTLADGQLSTNVVLLTGTQTLTGNKIFGGGLQLNATSCALATTSNNVPCFAGNTAGSALSVGTNDAFGFSIETANTVRINVDSSGNVGVNTGLTTLTSGFVVNTSFATAITTVTTTGALNGTQHTVMVNAASTTQTLPAATGVTGRIYTIKNAASGSATTIASSGGTINGAATYILSNANDSVEVQSDGTNWQITAASTTYPQILVESQRTTAFTLGAVAALPYNNATTNIGTAYNTTTGIFTAPAAGTYEISATAIVNMAASAGGDFYLEIYNNTGAASIQQVWDGDSNDTGGAAFKTSSITSRKVVLTSGQQISIRIATNSGGAKTIFTTNPTANTLQIIRLK